MSPTLSLVRSILPPYKRSYFLGWSVARIFVPPQMTGDPRDPAASLGLKLVGAPCVRSRYVSSQTRGSIFVGFMGPWDYPSCP